MYEVIKNLIMPKEICSFQFEQAYVNQNRNYSTIGLTRSVSHTLYSFEQ